MKLFGKVKGKNTIVIEWEIDGDTTNTKTTTAGNSMPDSIKVQLANYFLKQVGPVSVDIQVPRK